MTGQHQRLNVPPGACCYDTNGKSRLGTRLSTAIPTPSRRGYNVRMSSAIVWTVGGAYAALAIFLATRVVNRRYSTIKAIAVFTVAVSTGLSAVPLLLYFCR